MILAPRYEGSVILSIEGRPSAPREPFIRHGRRMQTMLAAFTDEQWASPSRCDGWTARDVVAHLITVNAFWQVSFTSKC